jgi:hypothetical protein
MRSEIFQQMASVSNMENESDQTSKEQITLTEPTPPIISAPVVSDVSNAKVFKASEHRKRFTATNKETSSW